MSSTKQEAVVKDQAFYSAIGKAGGAATKAKHGPEFFKLIGKKGGQAARHISDGELQRGRGDR
jgi:general stress protein YciG